MIISVGKSNRGWVRHRLDLPWEKFINYVEKGRYESADPSEKDESWWVAPFVLRADGDGRRTVANIDYMSAWCGLDVDHDNWSWNALQDVFSGLALIAYTTTHSRPEAQRWRLFIHLDRNCSVEEHARLFKGWQLLMDGKLDTSCDNPNRLFYLPACWAGADNQWHVSEGQPLSVDGVMAAIPPEPQTSPPEPSGRLLEAAPDGTGIVTRGMVAAACAKPEGGRLWAMMCASAKRFRVNGWHLSAEDLATAAVGEAEAFSHGKQRPDAIREAARALQWAEQFEPLSEIEKIRERILWERQKQQAFFDKFRKSF